MVHLTSVRKGHKDKSHHPEATGSRVSLRLSNDDDTFTTSVYGSKFAAEDLPKHEMPDQEMPKEIAYKLIKDELSLDGNPMLK